MKFKPALGALAAGLVLAVLMIAAGSITGRGHHTAAVPEYSMLTPGQVIGGAVVGTPGVSAGVPFVIPTPTPTVSSTPTLAPAAAVMSPWTHTYAGLTADAVGWVTDWVIDKGSTPPYEALPYDQYLARLAPHATVDVMRMVDSTHNVGLSVTGCLGPPLVRSRTARVLAFRVLCSIGGWVDVTVSRVPGGWVVSDARTASMEYDAGTQR